MKAVRIHEPGDAQALIYEDIDVPQPKAGEARVKLSASGLNFIDVYHRNGTYKLPLPATLGMEGAGVIDAVGEGVVDLQPGQRVAYTMERGSYAEYAVVPAWKLVPLPESVSNDQAAAIMLQGMTAHYLARSTFPLREGHACLIHAAAGGLGLLLTQIAKMAGARVIGTVSSEEKAELAKRAGADDVILYTRTDFAAEVPRILGARKLDVIYDSVGKDTFLKGLDLLAPRGMMVLCGASSGPVAPFDPLLLMNKGSLYVTRPTLGSYIQGRDELLARAGELFAWIRAGKLEVRIDRAFALRDAADAHAYLEGRHSKGKVLLEI